MQKIREDTNLRTSINRLELTAEERNQLLEITSKGRQPARVVKRANILLIADGWQHSDEQISEALSAGTL